MSLEIAVSHVASKLLRGSYVSHSCVQAPKKRVAAAPAAIKKVGSFSAVLSVGAGVQYENCNGLSGCSILRAFIDNRRRKLPLSPSTLCSRRGRRLSVSGHHQLLWPWRFAPANSQIVIAISRRFVAIKSCCREFCSCDNATLRGWAWCRRRWCTTTKA